MFFMQMKKFYQLLIISFATILLAGCNNSKTTEIDPNNWTSKEGASVENSYNQQIEESQYLKDLEAFLSNNVLLITENKPFISNTSLTATFDKESSLQGGLNFSQNKYSKSHGLEDMEIGFDIKVEGSEDELEPFYASGSLSLVYQNDDMYANIHKFGVFMGEGNMIAKMYTLLGESLIDKWVDLEANSGGFITINEKEDIKLQYILGRLKGVLKSEWINEDSPNFLNGVAELIDTVNSHIDLGISTDELKLITKEVKYFELSDGSIQRIFTGSFQGKESEFMLELISYRNGLNVRLYDIKNFVEDVESDYQPTDAEIIFSIKGDKKSEYDVDFKSLRNNEIVVDINGKLKYNDQLDFDGAFILEGSELTQGQKISGIIEGKIIKSSPVGDEVFPEISGEIITVTSILSSLL